VILGGVAEHEVQVNRRDVVGVGHVDVDDAGAERAQPLDRVEDGAFDLGIEAIEEVAAEYHARALTARPQDYTAPVRLRLEMARYVLAEDYIRAVRGKALIAHEVDRALDGLDALVLPALPCR
jgi:Asp-tRNA(Asn)/Glu-tRNA(Gln) amidotransferase A subunit family amidase